MEGDKAAPCARKVLGAFDEAWVKLRLFVKETVLPLPQLTEKQREALQDHMARDVMIFVPVLKDFLVQHAEAITKRDITHLILQGPAEVHDVKFSEAAIDKAFLFIRVFESLLKDLERSNEH